MAHLLNYFPVRLMHIEVYNNSVLMGLVDILAFKTVALRSGKNRYLLYFSLELCGLILLSDFLT